LYRNVAYIVIGRATIGIDNHLVSRENWREKVGCLRGCPDDRGASLSIRGLTLLPETPA
jgi:hypothetical protein